MIQSKPSPRPRRALCALAFAAAALLAACSSDSTAENADATGTTTTTEAATTTGPESETEETTTSAELVVEEPVIANDVETRSAEEIALDDLDIMIAQIDGIENLVPLADCVVERLESEEVPLTGQGSPELAALVGCDNDVISSLIGLNSAESTSETSDCVLDGIAMWIGGLPLTEAESFFQASTPPDELIGVLATLCSISRDEVTTLLS